MVLRYLSLINVGNIKIFDTYRMRFHSQNGFIVFNKYRRLRAKALILTLSIKLENNKYEKKMQVKAIYA